jgi:hypothetical protein
MLRIFLSVAVLTTNVSECFSVEELTSIPTVPGAGANLGLRNSKENLSGQYRSSNKEIFMISRNFSNARSRVLAFAFTIATFCMMFSGTASAQLSDQKTIVTFHSPVEIPGAGAQVLPAGTYVFKLADPKIDPNIVQILNREESHVFANILAIPIYRSIASDKTVITFEERPAGQPQAIHAWFYPDEKRGREFVYPNTKTTQPSNVADLKD